LYYNDYSIENKAKREGVFKLVKKLKEQNVPITAVGIQGQGWRIDKHYPLASDIEALINGVAALGVKTMITEMTIDVLPRDEFRGGRHTSQRQTREKNLILILMVSPKIRRKG